MTDDAIIVFTFKTVDRILEDGGSAAWRIKTANARQCQYVVCTRNTHDKRATGVYQEPHRAAFLVGRVRDVVAAGHREGRSVILMSEYALVSIPDAWRAGDRNPVRYATLKDLGIDPDTLDWQPMPHTVNPQFPPSVEDDEDDDDEVDAPRIRPLTMAEAKQGLALTFGVAPEAVEITIRG